MTYGSGLSPGKGPDLVAAYGTQGQLGYVRRSDLAGPMPTSLVTTGVFGRPHSIPLYARAHADERVACTFGCTGVRPMTGVRGYFGGAGRAGRSAGPDELAFCWRRECSAGSSWCGDDCSAG